MGFDTDVDHYVAKALYQGVEVLCLRFSTFLFNPALINILQCAAASLRHSKYADTNIEECCKAKKIIWPE